jgi:hypothetical protein
MIHPMLHRRLARDYETRSERSEVMIHLAMTDSWPAGSPAKAPSLGMTRQSPTKRRYWDEIPAGSDL